MQEDQEPIKLGRKIAQVRVGKVTVNLVTFPIALVLILAFMFFTDILFHTRPYASRDLIYIVILLIVFGLVHEGLHALALVIWGRVGPKDMKFGFSWRGLCPYYHCKLPITVKVYRITALFPLIILGGLCIMLLLVFPSIWFAAVTGGVIAASVGDIWVFCKLRGFDRECLVKDHPKEIGCDVFERASDV